MWYDIMYISREPFFYFSIFALILSIGFFVRGLKAVSPGFFYRYFMGLLCALLAVILFPATVSEGLRRGIALTITVLLAGFFLADLVMDLFMGRRPHTPHDKHFFKPRHNYLTEIYKALQILKIKEMGGLIILERSEKIDPHLGGCIPYESEIKAEIMAAIFSKDSVVHDGGLIIKDGRIKKLKAILPLSNSTSINLKFGTRHRAAIGITEKTDAVVFVVSEERGDISVAFNGTLVKIKSRDHFTNVVRSAMRKKRRVRKRKIPPAKPA